MDPPDPGEVSRANRSDRWPAGGAQVQGSWWPKKQNKMARPSRKRDDIRFVLPGNSLHEPKTTEAPVHENGGKRIK